MKKKVNKTRLITIVIIVFICSAVVLFLLPLKDYLYPWPSPPPKEQNRVFHPAGFSIVKPDKWLSKIRVKGEPEFQSKNLKIVTKVDSIFIYPDTKARFPDTLTVKKYSQKPVFEKYYKPYKLPGFSFKDGVQYENQQGKYFQWTGLVKLKEDWYCIQLMQPNDDMMIAADVPDYWWPFINSFKAEQKEEKK